MWKWCDQGVELDAMPLTPCMADTVRAVGISSMLLAINPELEQSARASGAGWLQTMRYVLVPLLAPAIVAAWLMLFVIFIRELGATILLYAQGTETISVALVVLSERSVGYVAALAMIQLMLLLMAFSLFRATRASLIQT